jgi:selenide,water dikinase
MRIDVAKRREVMERSQWLGHCICDVRRSCPCDVFTEQGICPCAGERPDPVDLAQVKLTALAHNAGCASKIAPADLDAVLSRLPAVTDPAVICGLAAGDDAAIYQIAEQVCLVQTVDVFTPCVDDPQLFGRICAANCLSDIYAMGGTPRTALSILAFPAEKLPGEVMYQMLAGAMAVFADAGVALLGGHSLKDDEIKLGFALTGVIDPAVAAALDRPRAGDVLVLTKPLGTGVLTFSQQVGRGHVDGLAAAQVSMATLNRAAADAMREAGASACTDITGFGLFGHLIRLLRQKHLGAMVFAEALPAFPGAREALRQGVVPGAVERNREYVGADLEVVDGVDPAAVQLGFDAQTSGGLLIAMPEGRLGDLIESLSRRGADAFVIGQIIEAPAGRIRVVPHPPTASSVASLTEPEIPPMKPTPASAAASHAGCCADVFDKQPQPDSRAETQRAFGALMRSVQAGGALDERTKELILFSLVLASRCAPCFAAHYRKAQALGLTRAELDEAAWCAVAMGGAPVRMFYEECLARVAQNQAGSA